MKKTPKIDLPSLNQLIEKVTAVKKKNSLDLSSDQDLSIAIMNLISIEEHFFFSGGKTQNIKYYDLINEAREMRKELLKKLIGKQDDGSERWCISKHLLAASMRLMEVGSKQLDQSNKTEAYDFFNKAYDLYAFFWGINLDLLDLAQVKDMESDSSDPVAVVEKIDQGKTSLRGVLGKMVQKVIDCCLE